MVNPVVGRKIPVLMAPKPTVQVPQARQGTGTVKVTVEERGRGVDRQAAAENPLHQHERRFVGCGTYTGGTSYSIAALDQTSVAAFSVTGNTVSDSPSVRIQTQAARHI